MSLFKTPVADPSLIKLLGAYNYQFQIFGANGAVDVQIGTMEFDGKGNIAFLMLGGKDPSVGMMQGSDYTVDRDTCSGQLEFRQHVIQSRVPLPVFIGYVATPDYSVLFLGSIDNNGPALFGQAVKIT